MSYREETFLQYKKSELIPALSYLDEIKEADVRDLFYEVLNAGIHGFCYSMYEEGQHPGIVISKPQVQRRLEILARHSSWVRSFSCTEGNELVPEVAKENGMKTLVGAWLGDDFEKNEEEIEGLIKLGKAGMVDVAAVGNEVLYRKELSVQQLSEYIRRVKEALPGIPVGYVDAYYEFTSHPGIVDLCDIILCNCYPFWEGTSFQDSLQHMRQMYYQAKAAGNGKRVIITETGWPSHGEALGGAVPSRDYAIKYFINSILWAQDEEVEIFYFSSFDESWKKGAEGEVGAYWGIWDSSNKLKY